MPKLTLGIYIRLRTAFPKLANPHLHLLFFEFFSDSLILEVPILRMRTKYCETPLFLEAAIVMHLLILAQKNFENDQTRVAKTSKVARFLCPPSSIRHQQKHT